MSVVVPSLACLGSAEPPAQHTHAGGPRTGLVQQLILVPHGDAPDVGVGRERALQERRALLRGAAAANAGHGDEEALVVADLVHADLALAVLGGIVERHAREQPLLMAAFGGPHDCGARRFGREAQGLGGDTGYGDRVRESGQPFLFFFSRLLRRERARRVSGCVPTSMAPSHVRCGRVASSHVLAHAQKLARPRACSQACTFSRMLTSSHRLAASHVLTGWLACFHRPSL